MTTAPGRRLLAKVYVGTLALAPALAGACHDGDPFPGCPGQERVPALCSDTPEGPCTCNDHGLQRDGQVFSTLTAIQAPARCRKDGSDWETCDCPTGARREECVAACATMRCTAACDDRSVVSCEQRCQDFFDDHEHRRGAPPDRECAVAIATIALCTYRAGCPEAPPCVEAPGPGAQADLYDSACSD